MILGECGGCTLGDDVVCGVDRLVILWVHLQYTNKYRDAA